MVESRGFCALHLRRFISGHVREDDAGELVDYCAQGHAMVGDNVRWESSGKRGKKRRRCRSCLRDKAQRQAKNALVVVETPKPYRPIDITLTQAVDDFEEAKKHVTAKCAGNSGPYMDWEWGDAPSAEEAQALCAGCPLMQACGNYGRAAQMSDGIWGGHVVEMGVWLS
jgi:hypothetical protein